MSTATFPTEGLTSPFQPVYTPADVAALLGVNEDTITRHWRKRPNLFPTPEQPDGWCIQWKPEQLPAVLSGILTMSWKARAHVMARFAIRVRALPGELASEVVRNLSQIQPTPA